MGVQDFGFWGSSPECQSVRQFQGVIQNIIRADTVIELRKARNAAKGWFERLILNLQGKTCIEYNLTNTIKYML